MRDYSKVGPKFWIGATGKRLRAAGMEAQIVAMYLLTNPHANMLGLYYCPIMFIAHETGLGLEGSSKGLQSAIEAGFCEYDEASEVVWVIEMASYQIGEALKPNDLRVKGVQNEYGSLPENPYLARFYEKYSAAFCMSVCRGKAGPSEAPFKPLRSQEQEQEKEQEQERLAHAAPAAPAAKSQEIVTAFQEACRQAWGAYSDAYLRRYGTEPVRNAKVNRQVQELVKRLGADEAPQVAAWFLGHPGGYYVGKCHDIGALVADAEKLRTEWATGRVMTNSKARQSDRAGGTAAALAEVLAEQERAA